MTERNMQAFTGLEVMADGLALGGHGLTITRSFLFLDFP